MDNNAIQHHGILGMKWGVRRFQNKDGSLTPSGKKRKTNNNPEAVESRRTRRLKDAIKSYDEDIAEFKTGYNDKKGRVIISDQDARRTRDALIRDQGKLKVKLIKSQYADQYNAGKSAVSRILTKITNADNYYAETKYNLRNYYA